MSIPMLPPFWVTLDENMRQIKRTLVAINVQEPEISAMLEAYRESVLKRRENQQ